MRIRTWGAVGTEGENPPVTRLYGCRHLGNYSTNTEAYRTQKLIGLAKQLYLS